MRYYFSAFVIFWLLFVHQLSFGQLVPVIDKKAIGKSAENLALNLLKNQQYKKIRGHTEDTHTSYWAIQSLQQQVQDELKNISSIQDLHWSDLSKSIYLATELIKGSVQPGLEIDYTVEHPLFNQYPAAIYRELFLADNADLLPTDLTMLQEGKQRSEAIITSFHRLAAERKAYVAVAFQYLSDDLLVKATELNEVLKQPNGFSMTEAERLRLQTFSEEYLLLAAQMLERSDRLLLDVSSVKPMQRQANQSRMQLERFTFAQTPTLHF